MLLVAPRCQRVTKQRPFCIVCFYLAENKKLLKGTKKQGYFVLPASATVVYDKNQRQQVVLVPFTSKQTLIAEVNVVCPEKKK